MPLTVAEAMRGSFALGVLILGGLAVLGCVLPRRIFSSWIAHLALAHLVGSAVMAWTATAVGVATGRLTPYPVYAVFGLAAFGAWLLRGRAQAACAVEAAGPDPAGGLPVRLWTAFVMVAVALGIASVASGLITDPSMGIDSYTMWALKGKVFSLANSFQPLLQRCCDKPGYPVLFPLQSWWIYRHLGHIETWWHQAMGFFFYLDTVAIAFAGCRLHVRPVWAWMATAVVANNPVYVLLVTRGFADSTLSAFFLASAVLLVKYLSSRDARFRAAALLVLLGALQTKNEGLAWAFVCVAMLLCFEVCRRRFAPALLTAGFYVAAICPWVIFKVRSHLVGGPDEPMASLQTLQAEWARRLGFILHAHFADFGTSGLPFLLVLCVPLLWVGWNKVSKPVLAVIGAQFCAYLVVDFIVQDPAYQVNGFLARGLSHLAPALIVVSLTGAREFLEVRPVRHARHPAVPVLVPPADDRPL